MGFPDVAFMPSRGRFATTFLNTCGRSEGHGTTTCLKCGCGKQGHSVLGVDKGILWLG